MAKKRPSPNLFNAEPSEHPQPLRGVQRDDPETSVAEPVDPPLAQTLHDLVALKNTLASYVQQLTAAERRANHAEERLRGLTAAAGLACRVYENVYELNYAAGNYGNEAFQDQAAMATLFGAIASYGLFPSQPTEAKPQ